MMNRGVMQRQMFSNGGESNLRTAVEEQRLVQRKEDNLKVRDRMAQEALRKRQIIMEIEFLMGDLPVADKEVFLQQPNSVLENTLTYVREKYGKDDLLDRMNLREIENQEIDNLLEETNRKYDEMLAQDREFDIAPSAQQAIPSDMLMRGGQRDPNITEQMGINAPMNRMEMLKNQQQVSAGRATPAPSRDMLRDFQGDVNMTQGNIDRELGDSSDLETLQRMRRYQGMAAGGEAVPNRLKGFSKLPESVQMQMNPSLAKRYQQGGIASMMDPASMPQGDPMMGGQMDPAQIAMMEAEQAASMPQGGQMDPEMMALMEAEAAGQAQGEQIGAMVGEQTMAGLDQAEDFQGAIDALRGNSAPLEARYQELAGFVGDQDAMQTPESVLAMVQPTIMMTEEGAVDSGIGQLMEQITGNIVMETPDGQPTAMAEGVGSLMGVGQQPTEKKLLADGGAVGLVPAYQSAGEVSYDDILKRFQTVGGDPQARKDALQSDIYFNLADRALAFAGGVDPRTGENMAGAPLLSQVGRAGAGLGATIGEKLASNRALDQQLRTAALSETLSQEKEGRARSDALSLATLKSASELQKQELINAGALSKINLKSKLDTQSKMTIEQLEQEGRIDLAKFNLSGDETLEELRQKGVLTLEDYKQANRTTLEGTLQQNREALEALRQSGTAANLIQADKLEKENTLIKADLELNKLEVANQFEIENIKLKGDQAVEINNTNNALKEKLAKVTNRLKEREVQVRENSEDRQLANDNLNLLLDERRVKVSEFNSKISAAQGQEKNDLIRARDAFNETSTLSEQDLKERKLLLDKNKLALDQVQGEEKVRLEEEKLALEMASSKFNKFGKGVTGKVLSMVSDPDILAKYANGELTDADGTNDSLMNTALTKYNQPSLDWSDEKKAWIRVEGLALTPEMLNAIKVRKDNGRTIPNIKLDRASDGGGDDGKKTKVSDIDNFTSTIMEGIDNPALAFGSPAAFKSFANVFVESISLGFLDSVAPEAKEAIKSIDNLNVKFLNEMQKAAKLRDSVAQLDLFKSLIPQTSKLFVGKGDAISSTKAIIKRVDEEIEALDLFLNIKNVGVNSKDYAEIQMSKIKLQQMRAGYNAIVKANTFAKKFDKKAIDEAGEVLFGGQ